MEMNNETLCRYVAYNHACKYYKHIEDRKEYGQIVDRVTDWLIRRVNIYQGAHPDAHPTTIKELIWRLSDKPPGNLPIPISVEFVE